MKVASLKLRSLKPALRAAALVLACTSAPAAAQLGLPSLGLPRGIGPLDLDRLRAPAGQLLDRTPLPNLARLRVDQVNALLTRHPQVLEADPLGNPAVRGEILAWNPAPAGLEAAARAGLAPAREEDYPELGQRLLVLRAPPGAALAALVERLRGADPEGAYDFNHVYVGGGAAASAPDQSGKLPDDPGPGRGIRVGLVDSGADRGHPVFAGSSITQWGCDGQPRPAGHGTAVAALMVGESGVFRGAAPGASLYAADVYCDDPAGGSVERITAALAWLAREQVGVINISLVGPGNAALARVVAAMQARGHLLVAAVGNDGPAAAPLYPASYPGVVGVSGVDRRGRPLPEAARGAQVMFAAPGAQMVSAAPGTPPYRQVRGTSFAAPIVAALLARHLPRADSAAARRALDGLRQAAGLDRRLDDTVGFGIVGKALRTDPAAMQKNIFSDRE